MFAGWLCRCCHAVVISDTVITITKEGSCSKVPQVYKLCLGNMFLFMQLIDTKVNSFGGEQIAAIGKEVYATNIVKMFIIGEKH